MEQEQQWGLWKLKELEVKSFNHKKMPKQTVLKRTHPASCYFSHTWAVEDSHYYFVQPFFRWFVDEFWRETRFLCFDLQFWNNKITFLVNKTLSLALFWIIWILICWETFFWLDRELTLFSFCRCKKTLLVIRYSNVKQWRRNMHKHNTEFGPTEIRFFFVRGSLDENSRWANLLLTAMSTI